MHLTRPEILYSGIYVMPEQSFPYAFNYITILPTVAPTDSGFVQSVSIPNDLDPASHQGSQQGSTCI
jgi:hypothetical protein